MPDVQPIIPIGDPIPSEQADAIYSAIRDLSDRFRRVPPEAAFSVLVSFLVSACAAQEHPMRSLNQLVGAVAEGIAEVQAMPQVGVS